jgi:hypothetical protein
LKTLLLDEAAWDLVLDAGGNIALAAEPYALAQDAACAIRTFAGEVYYNTTLGIPYWQQVLGHAPPASLMKALFTAAALDVPGVVSAQCFLRLNVNRQVSGQVQIRDAAGNVVVAG